MPTNQPPSNAAAINAAMAAARTGDFSGVAAAVRIWTGQHRVLDGTDLFDLERSISELMHAVAAAGYTNATIHAWIRKATTSQDRHSRRAAAHIATLVLGDHLVPGEPWERLDLDPLTQSRRRPLLAFELAACRVVIQLAGISRPRQGTIFGLREAGACATEVSAVTQAGTDVRHRRVDLPGNGRVDTRTGPLTTWALPHITDLIATIPEGAVGDENPLVYRGKHAPGSSQAAAAPGMDMKHILTTAWIDAPDVGPDSVRNTHALTRYGNRNPLPVQQFLGSKSIDQAMREIGELPHKALRQRRRPAA